MDQKALVPRKRLVAVNSEAGISVKGNEEENLSYDKASALEETVKNLHEQVACLLCECAKDELMAEHVKIAQEAIAGFILCKIDCGAVNLYGPTSLKVSISYISDFQFDQPLTGFTTIYHRRSEDRFLQRNERIAKIYEFPGEYRQHGMSLVKK